MSEKKLTKSSSRELSEEQKEIVESPEEYIFVSAGPGTGKTRVLTERIRYLAENCRIRHEEILILTFTKSSSKEIQSRLDDYFEPKTIDAYCLSKLNKKGIKPAPDGWVNGWLHDYYRKESFDYLTKKHASVLLNEWFEIKDFLDNCSNLSGSYSFTGINLELPYEKLNKLIFKFEEDLKKAKYVIYPQIRREVIQDWSKNGYKANYKAIIVDEIQDVNTQGLKIIGIISGSKNVKSVFLVGDLNQSIYSFRGSNSKKLLDWIEEKRFKKFYLNRNYRSNKHIVNVCNVLIEDEDSKIFVDKEKEEGEKVLFKGFKSTQLEAEWIVNSIKKHKENGIPLKEMVVLVRSTNDKFSDLADLKNLLKKEKIYCNSSNRKEHEYKEEVKIIKEYVDLVRYFNNTDKCVKILKELLKFHPFKKEKKIVLKLEKFIEKEELDFMKALYKFSCESLFLDMLWKSLKEIQEIKEKKLSTVVQLIYEKNIKWFYVLGKKKFLHHHVKALSFIGELKNHYPECYLEDFDKIYPKIVSEESSNNGLTISTIHKAKGLEWDCVFVRCGRIKEINTDPTDDKETIFVAFSRAKKFLYVTLPKTGKFSFESYEFIDKKKLEKIADFDDWE